MRTLEPKQPISARTDSLHYLGKEHSVVLSKIPGIERIALDSPLVQATFIDQSGSKSLLEARLERNERGFYLTSNSRNWPTKDSHILSLDKLEVINGGQVAKINLLLNPQNLEQAFKLSAGTAIGVRVSHDYKEMFVLSVGRDGIINAVELTSAGPLIDCFYKIDEKGELIRIDGEDQFSDGKIKSVNKLNSKMRLDLKTGQTENIQVNNEAGQLVAQIAPYELIEAGTEVTLTQVKADSTNKIQHTGFWHGVQHGMAVITDKNKLNVQLVPLEQITEIDNFGFSYNVKDDLAVALTAKSAKKTTPGAYTVSTGSISSSQIPFSSGSEFYKVAQ